MLYTCTRYLRIRIFRQRSYVSTILNYNRNVKLVINFRKILQYLTFSNCSSAYESMLKYSNWIPNIYWTESGKLQDYLENRFLGAGSHNIWLLCYEGYRTYMLSMVPEHVSKGGFPIEICRNQISLLVSYSLAIFMLSYIYVIS